MTDESTRRREPPLTNVANMITFARFIFAILFFVFVSWEDSSVALNVAFVLFVVAALSDILDGYLARKYSLASSFGRLADPFVDKILICGGFIFLMTEHQEIRPWMVMVIVGRELLVTAMRSFFESRKAAFAANVMGKMKMFLQSFTIGGFILVSANFHDSRLMWSIVPVALWAAVIITAVSGFIYCLGLPARLRDEGA